MPRENMELPPRVTEVLLVICEDLLPVSLLASQIYMDNQYQCPPAPVPQQNEPVSCIEPGEDMFRFSPLHRTSVQSLSLLDLTDEVALVEGSLKLK